MNLSMKLVKSILQFKPTLKRLAAAIVICSPMVALTNNLQKPARVPVVIEGQTEVEKAANKAAGSIPRSFPHDLCFGVQPPRF